ncbi:ATP-binding protein [Siminovitchia acidinfaciens]|uniref:ATP-binding protein n=1 Tax=Siminovitchia acidinfaciens TaxID=2321395 RepID=A0A429Y412_9BACI|nr:ATP-binding protein [Siminovitchia acidinfaciens]RST76163.1 ATP-binding protein [Siminovitchia acidinfaciens]
MNNYTFAEAIYSDSPVKEYANNPLIEALPPILTSQKVIHLMSVFPHFDINERFDSDEIRFHYIQRLYDYFHPLTRHIALERRFSTVIRKGYVNRNPISKDTVKYMNDSYKSLKEGKLPEPDQINTENTVQGFSLIGVSGTGKSTTYKRIIKSYPKYIKHTNHKGNHMNIAQIPFLNLECPSDGSLGGLCHKFFEEVDLRIGSKYKERFKNYRVQYMLTEMVHLTRLHNVGVLIIDEIQHLSVQKVQGVNKMLNFFVGLVNQIGVPVILIGTNKAFDMLNKEFRQALRSDGQGSNKEDWERMKNDRNWQLVMDGLLHYQWTRTPVENEEDLLKIKNALYVESQGIIGIAVKLFAATQMEAILNRKETITEELIQSTFKRCFGSLQPMIDALKSGNQEEINKYDDLKERLKEIMNQIEDDYKTNILVQAIEEAKSKGGNDGYYQLLTVRLANKITDSKIVQSSVKEVLSKFNYHQYSIDELFQMALTIAEGKITRKKGRKNKNNSTEALKENDLRKLRLEALDRKISTYEMLKEKNIILDYNLFEKGVI